MSEDYRDADGNVIDFARRTVHPPGGWQLHPDGSWSNGTQRADKNGNVISPVDEDDTDFTEESIPPRPWIVPGYLLRRSVTMLAGPGSAGKSSLMIGWAVALVLNKEWNRFTPLCECSVALYNVEDDADEQKRRIAAVLRQFEKLPIDLAKKLIRLTPNGTGTLIRYNPDTRLWEHTAAMQALIEMLGRRKPDVLILDPFVELHDAEENDNTAIRAVLAMFRVIAAEFNCAVVILHHTRKDITNGAGDMNVFRGAGASVAAARIALTVLPMSAEEAENLKISEDMRRSFVRMDSAKSNYSPPNTAEWFELTEYQLDNGEAVAAAIPWKPPTDAPLVDRAQDDLCAAAALGINKQPYSPQITEKQARSVAQLFLQFGIRTLDGQRKALARLFACGFRKCAFRDANGDKRQGLRSREGQPDAEWLE